VALAVDTNPVIAAYLASADWVAVRSTNVARVARVDAFNYVFVEFKDLSVYLYEQVPEGVYRGLLAAPSKGQYVWAVLRNRGKDDRYPTRKVR